MGRRRECLIWFDFMSYLPTPPLGQDMTQDQFFKRNLTGFNSEISFSKTSCLTKAEEPSLSYYLAVAGGRIIGFIPFPNVLVICEMESASSRIWTRATVSISYDDNHYTTGTTSVLISGSSHGSCGHYELIYADTFLSVGVSVNLRQNQLAVTERVRLGAVALSGPKRRLVEHPWPRSRRRAIIGVLTITLRDMVKKKVMDQYSFNIAVCIYFLSVSVSDRLTHFRDSTPYKRIKRHIYFMTKCCSFIPKWLQNKCEGSNFHYRNTFFNAYLLNLNICTRIVWF